MFPLYLPVFSYASLIPVSQNSMQNPEKIRGPGSFREQMQWHTKICDSQHTGSLPLWLSKRTLNLSPASSFHEHNRGSSLLVLVVDEGNRSFKAHSGTTSTSITDQVWLLTISFGSPLTLTTGNRQKEKRWQLVSSILESSHSRGGEHVGMLGERVQHMHVYIARHKVPNQLNFPFMVCRGNGTHTRKGWCKYAGERKREKEEIKGEMGKKNHKRV